MSNGDMEVTEINFNDAQPGRDLPLTIEKDGVTFEYLDDQYPQTPFRTVTVPNSGDIGIMFGADGFEMRLPWRADWASVKAGWGKAPPLTLSAVGGKLAGTSMTGPKADQSGYVLEVTGDQFGALKLEGGGGEGVLIWLRIGRKIK